MFEKLLASKKLFAPKHTCTCPVQSVHYLHQTENECARSLAVWTKEQETEKHYMDLQREFFGKFSAGEQPSGFIQEHFAQIDSALRHRPGHHVQWPVITYLNWAGHKTSVDASREEMVQMLALLLSRGYQARYVPLHCDRIDYFPDYLVITSLPAHDEMATD